MGFGKWIKKREKEEERLTLTKATDLPVQMPRKTELVASLLTKEAFVKTRVASLAENMDIV